MQIQKERNENSEKRDRDKKSRVQNNKFHELQKNSICFTLSRFNASF